MDVSRLKPIVIVIVLAFGALVVAVGVLTFTINPGSTGEPTVAAPAAVEPSPDSPAAPEISVPAISAGSEDIVVTVNGTSISGEAWAKATQLDTAMNLLAGRPEPDPEAILDRLVNEQLVLESGFLAPDFSEAAAESRLQQLMATWQVSEPVLADTLDAVGITRPELINRIQHLLAVENVLKQMTEAGTDMNVWLPQTRAEAEIGLGRPIANAMLRPEPEFQTPAEPVEPQPSVSAPAPPADLPVAPVPAAAAPDFSLPTLDGQSVSLSQFRGKPVLINFWATWCPYCREELPALQATADRYGDDIVILAVDSKESGETVRAFAETMALTFPILLDESGEVSDRLYQVRGIPTSFFVDADGVIVDRYVGPLDEATIDSYLQPLLAATDAEVKSQPADEVSAPVYPPRAGNPAPAFSATDDRGETFTLDDALAEGPVVMVFYRGRT